MNLSTLLSLGGGQKPKKVYSNYVPGSYVVTIPSDVWFVIATVQAGGGSGSQSYHAVLSQIGATCGELWLEKELLVTPGSIIPIVVGAGGSQVLMSYSTNRNGANGGASSFGSLVAKGGIGSIGNNSTDFPWTTYSASKPTTLDYLNSVAIQGKVGGIISKLFGYMDDEREIGEPSFIPPFFPPISVNTSPYYSTLSTQLTRIGHRTPPSVGAHTAILGYNNCVINGGGRSWWANGSLVRKDASITTTKPGFGAGGGSYATESGSYGATSGDPGGDGFVELVYFSDYEIA